MSRPASCVPRAGALGAARIAPLVLLAACGGGAAETEPQTAAEAPPADAVTRTTERGPVRVGLHVWPPRPSLGEAVRLRLVVDAPTGVEVDAPFQEAGDGRLGRFRVVSFARSKSRRDDGGSQETQDYALEAPASGRHRVPPLRLEMTDARDGATARATEEILTDEIPLEIAPVPEAQATAALRPSGGPLDPDVGRANPWIVAAAVVGCAGLVATAVAAVRAIRARRRVAVQRSAYDEAMSRIRVLHDGGPPRPEAADAWFVELSSVVRRYIELRHEIRAPELTTEEFLQVATARPELTAAHRALLTSFLERCDRVKFAGYRPSAAESVDTLEAARRFVEETRLREETRP